MVRHVRRELPVRAGKYEVIERVSEQFFESFVESCMGQACAQWIASALPRGGRRLFAEYIFVVC